MELGMIEKLRRLCESLGGRFFERRNRFSTLARCELPSKVRLPLVEYENGVLRIETERGTFEIDVGDANVTVRANSEFGKTMIDFFKPALRVYEIGVTRIDVEETPKGRFVEFLE